jgi:LAS superfamily LD-carboxypeptidase LdcB
VSNRKRRPAHRAEPVRTPLAARVHDLTPARLAQGGVVAVLVAGLCTTITAQASASGSGPDRGRTAAIAAARDGAVDVAADALEVADAVQLTAARTSGVSAAKLAELRTAAAQVDALITEAEGRTSTAGDTRREGDTASPSAPATSSSPAATTSPSATASSAPPADATASDTATPAASPTGASGGTDEGAAAVDAAPASDDPTASPSTAATPAATDAATVPGATVPGAAVPGATVAGAAKTAPPAPVTTSPSTTAATAGPAPTPTATDAPAPGPTSAPTGPSSAALDATVPTIPDTAGPEDRTTEELRAAVAHLAAVAADVRAELADETARQAAADKAAADQAAAKKAAATKAAAAKAAAEKAAAERKAAQRAAWKKSLRGFPNGRIPASALCGIPFDSSALLRCDAAEALTALDKAYVRAFGHHLEVSDSYRSYGAQVACRATKGYLCAQPGTSNHGWGVAVDLGGGIQSFGTATHAWMNRNAAKFGWHHPGWAEPSGSKPEPWHWEYTG